MPRRRSSTGSTEDNTTTQEENSTMSTTETEIQGLDEDFITQLLSKSRPRGVYDEAFMTHLNAGVRGARVDNKSGSLQGKNATSIKTGLENARKRIAEKARKGEDGFEDVSADQVENVKIILHKENENDPGTVYFVNPAVAAA